MASTINASNGATSGLIQTGDASGVLELQTNNGTTALSIGTNQVVTLAQPLPVASGGTGATSLNGIASQWTTTGSDIYYNTGNLGLGVTPSAWGSARKAFQLNGGSVYATTAGDTVGVSQNAYNDGAGWKYVSNGYASSYYQNSGGHYFNIAPSGTAGNAISFTQAMTLDASGNLGIGTTSLSGNGRLELNAPSGNNTNVTFYENGASRWLIGSVTGSNAFRFYDLANAAERFQIASTGAWGLAGANYGTSGQVLTSAGSGSAPTWSTPAGGFSAMTVITSSTTFTIPSGKTTLKVTVVGGGGGGGGAGGGSSGGTGGSTTVASGTQTISTVTGGGGSGGGPENGSGGAGGTASGGSINSTGSGGGGGSSTGYVSSGVGGSSILGGGARGNISYSSGNTGSNYGGGGSGASQGGGSTSAGGGGGGGGAIVYLTGLTPGNTLTVTIGSGGSGGIANNYAGGAGAAGVVIFEY